MEEKEKRRRGKDKESAIRERMGLEKKS